MCDSHPPCLIPTVSNFTDSSTTPRKRVSLKAKLKTRHGHCDSAGSSPRLPGRARVCILSGRGQRLGGWAMFASAVAFATNRGAIGLTIMLVLRRINRRLHCTVNAQTLNTRRPPRQPRCQQPSTMRACIYHVSRAVQPKNATATQRRGQAAVQHQYTRTVDLDERGQSGVPSVWWKVVIMRAWRRVLGRGSSA